MSSPVSVSIVVPVYNVAPHIGRCVDSVISQTYPHLECIFVDDCGNDNSMEIVRERIANYRGNIRFKILTHERNRGLSAARNTGTAAASGEYVWFVDSDDFILDDVVFDIFRRVGDSRPDVIVFSYASFSDGENFRANLVMVPAHKNIVDLLTGTCVEKTENWGAQFRIYRKFFLLEKSLSFCEGLIHEDVDFFISLLVAGTEKILSVPCCSYFYRNSRAGSIMSFGFPAKRMDSLLQIAERVKALFYESNSSKEKLIYVQIFMEMVMSYLSGLGAKKTQNKRHYFNEISMRRSEFSKMLKLANSRAARICAGTLKVSPKISVLFLKILNSIPVVIFRTIISKLVKFLKNRLKTSR